MPPASASAATSAPLPQPAGPTPGQAAVAGGVRGMFTGLVLGIIWGCYEEKKFVLRNCIKEYHLRESPIRLFSVMRRSVTTAPVVAAFVGVHSGLRVWWLRRQQSQQGRQGHAQGQEPLHLEQQVDERRPPPEQQRQQQSMEEQAAAGQRPGVLPWLPPDRAHQPVLAGAAGTAAGAVRSVLAEAALTMHPWIHAQRSLAAGLAAAGLFALGGALEEEQRRQRGQAEQWSEALELTGDD